MKLTGQVAIVTGAARGLGRAFALHLAGLGADVMAVDVDFAAATAYGEELGAESVVGEVAALGRQAERFEGDLTQAETARRMAAACLQRFGRIDILVNNAGGNVVPTERSQPSVTPPGDTALMFELNVMSMLHGCQAVADAMKAARSGVIVNLSSAAARYIPPDGSSAAYGAAKAAVAHYTRSLARELGPFGIRVNALSPGVIWTSRLKALSEQRGIGRAADVSRVPLGRYGNPQDCALVLEFLVTDLSRYVTGQCISVCGGTHLTPA